MKNNYLKIKKVYIVFLFSCMLFAVNSCTKSNELYGIWESDYFEVEYKSSVLPSRAYLDEELILRGTIIFNFDKTLPKATADFNSLELFDRKNNISYHNAINHSNPVEEVSYSYDGKNVTITFDANYSFLGEKVWSGKINKTTMNLKIVSGKTVKFKKIKK